VLGDLLGEVLGLSLGEEVGFPLVGEYVGVAEGAKVPGCQVVG